MHIIRVEKISASSMRCECLVNENTHMIHLRDRRPNPEYCRGLAKCIVGDEKMCYRHAQFEIFHLLLRGTHLLIRK